ncbi:hypothetical protein DFR58_13412 [Anaerobacterium chartisolvens]|uniref:Uncharacterized protein n=1 Tax=Anaerobacterium chartisolvens TaxID=1297424 RepID=A0A369AMQ8_9FIRM|nr:hypothetical protein DFR58_13412 [Anaerobacterium chartisolvens]
MAGVSVLQLGDAPFIKRLRRFNIVLGTTKIDRCVLCMAYLEI